MKELLKRLFSIGLVLRALEVIDTNRNAPAKQVLDRLRLKPDEKGGVSQEIKINSFICDLIALRTPALDQLEM